MKRNVMAGFADLTAPYLIWTDEPVGRQSDDGVVFKTIGEAREHLVSCLRVLRDEVRGAIEEARTMQVEGER